MEWTNISQFALGDAPYAVTRRNLEARFHQGKSPLVALQAYLPKAKKGDVKALFAAAACAVHNDYTSQQETQSQRRQHSEQVLELIEKAPNFPTNYDCVRIRFLLEQSARGYYVREQKLKPIASMLLKRRPNDFEVEREYGWILTSVGDLVSEQGSRAYFKKMMMKYPAQATVFKAMLASTYSSIPARQADPAIVNKEIALRRELLTSCHLLSDNVRNRAKVKSAQRQLQNAESFKQQRGI